MAEATRKKGLESVRAVLVVEDDESIQHFISEPLEAHGIRDIQCFATGEAAWEAAQSKEYDLIVLDWKMRGISGLGMLNRFRTHDYYRQIPILVVSGYIGRKDFSLLDEYPYTGRLIKPFEDDDMIEELEKLMAEAQWYKKQENAIVNLFQAMNMHAGKIVEAVKELVKSAPNPFPLVFAACRHLRLQGKITEAEALISIALKLAPDSIMLMNEFGKILLMTKRYKEAEQVLLRAQELSPTNLDRLCDLGEISLNQLNPERAHDFFDKALKIDDASSKATMGKNFSANISKFMATGKKVGLTENFASLLNSMGITMVRNGHFDKGFEHYRNAMAYVHDADDRSKLAFNLGLGHIRNGDPEAALGWFRKSAEWGVNFRKAAPHVQKMEDNVRRKGAGQPLNDIEFELPNEEATAEFADFDTGGIITEITALAPDTTAARKGSEVKWGTVEESAKPRWETSEFAKVRAACPEVDEIVRELVNAGYHLEIQVQRLTKLFMQYGEALFRDALREGLKKKQFTAADIAHVLSKGDKAA